MFRIAICDDDRGFIRYLKEKILTVMNTDVKIEFWEFHSGEELLWGLYGRKECDILFLDVQLPEMDGYTVAKKFREKYNSAILIFCSGVALPTPEYFKVTPYRYLLKQYSDRRMEKELQEVAAYLLKKKEQPYIWGCFERTRYRLSLDDILYISIAKRGCTAHLLPNSMPAGVSGEMICQEKLADLYAVIKDYGFAYAHNSYVVNLKYVTKRSMTELELTDGSILNISRSRGKSFEAEFVRYLASKY